eukprot:403359747
MTYTCCCCCKLNCGVLTIFILDIIGLAFSLAALIAAGKNKNIFDEKGYVYYNIDACPSLPTQNIHLHYNAVQVRRDIIETESLQYKIVFRNHANYT